MKGNAHWTYQDFTPLWSATSNTFAIALRAYDDRFNDLSDLIAYMKENPGDLRYSPGVDSVNKDDMKVLAALSDMEDASATYGGAALVGSFDMDMANLSPSDWNWRLVRKDTPEDVVTRLRDAMEAAFKRDDGRQRLLDMGDVPTGFSPDQYEEIVGAVAGELEHGQAAIDWETERLNGL